jgi:hypothetical protein
LLVTASENHILNIGKKNMIPTDSPGVAQEYETDSARMRKIIFLSKNGKMQNITSLIDSKAKNMAPLNY